MKLLVVLAIAVACANADVLTGDAAAPIVRSSFDSSPEGTFSYGFESGNKINVQADGVLKNPNSEAAALEVRGAYGYVSPDGTPVETTYIANENGFQPQGSHIPVAPEIPEAILRALKYIEAHPPAVEPSRKN